MPWERTEEGWLLTVQVDQANEAETPLWVDDHLKVLLTIQEGQALYRVRIDQRRVYQEVLTPQWVALFFGQSPRIRTGIKGQRLWRDRQIVLQRYGRKPRSYIVVAR
jgi:hypothetical protein